MNSQTSEALASLSQRFDAFQLELADVANCLDALIVTDGQESYGPGDAGCRRVEDQARWMKAARRELDGLIREVEGPVTP